MEDEMAAGPFGRARNYGWDDHFKQWILTTELYNGSELVYGA